jgi:hypothetical protein
VSGIACLLIGQKDPYRAWGRKGPAVASSNCILGHCRPSVGRGVVVVVAAAAVGAWLVAGSFDAELGTDRGKGLGRPRWYLGHRPCRLAHRTPVLYSRNQSRTNIALCKEKRDRRGRVSLPSCSI